jgi:transcription antitermination factor NusG
MSYWAVVQAEPRVLIPGEKRDDESLAEQLFARNGFESYLPRIKSRAADRKLRIAPLFPGYIFVRVVDQWYPIAWTIGVIRILMAGDHPARMPEKAMEEIRSREGRDGFVKLVQPRTLKKGVRVRVLSGQFQGHIGLYDGMSAKERERVLLDLLGRSVRVELARGDRIEALDVA